MSAFDKWMRLVDGCCWSIAGCSVYDLPDCDFYCWYDDGLPPFRAARRALKRAGFRS